MADLRSNMGGDGEDDGLLQGSNLGENDDGTNVDPAGSENGHQPSQGSGKGDNQQAADEEVHVEDEDEEESEAESSVPEDDN